MTFPKMILLLQPFLFLLLMAPTNGKVGSEKEFKIDSSNQQYFMTKPRDRELVEGADVIELECQVGNVMGRVQWSKDGFLLGYETEIPGYPRYNMYMDPLKGIYNLRIRKVILDDEGDYQCQVGPGPNNNKPIRAGATISVIIPPVKIILTPFYTNSFLPVQTKHHHHPEKSRHHHHPSKKHHNNHHLSPIKSHSGKNSSKIMDVSEGEKILLKCKTSSMTKPATEISWTRNGAPLTEGVIERLQEDEERNLFSTESIVSLFVKLDDQGSVYKCYGRHPAVRDPERITDDIRVSVLYGPGKPEIQGYLGDEVLQVGDKLTLGCMSRGGNPSPTLVWTRDGLVMDSTSTISSDSITTNTYSFTVRPEDNRKSFRCEASNMISNLGSEVQLQVHFSPVNIKVNGPTVGRINDILRYECIIGPSNPVPSQIVWLINGIPQKDGVYPIENWEEEISYGFMSKTNITVLLSESIKTVSCLASSSVEQTDLTSIQSSINVHVLFPPGEPTIIGYDTGQELREGDILKLKCGSLGGYPLPTIKWVKTFGSPSGSLSAKSFASSSSHPFRISHEGLMEGGGSHLQEKEIAGLETRNGHSGVSSELYIRLTASDNGATYKCIVVNEAISTPLTTSVLLRPVYFISDSLKVTPSDSVVVKAEETQDTETELTCESGECFPSCNLTWFWNGLEIEATKSEINKRDSVGDNGGLKTVSRLHYTRRWTSNDDSSTITCVSTNPFLANKRNSKEIPIQVLYKPEFPILNKNKSFDVEEGKDEFHINLPAKGNPGIIHYFWSKNGLLLTSNKRVLIEGSSLTMKEINRDDQGVYSVRAANVQGSSNSSFNLNVLFGSWIERTSGREVLVKEGDPVNLTCVVNPGIGAHGSNLSISWFSQRLKASFPSIERDESPHILSTLMVAQASEDDLTCSTFNGVGRREEETLSIRLMHPPRILNTTGVAGSVVGIAGNEEQIDLVCESVGKPVGSFYWFLHDKQIDSRSERYSIAEEPSMGDTLISRLTIHNVNPRDVNSQYKCVAFNDLGRDERQITLRNKGKPDAPRDIQVIGSSWNSVHLKWVPGFDGGFSQWFIVQVNDQQEVQVDTDEVVLEQLKGGREYMINIRSANSQFGSSIESQSLVITTPERGDSLPDSKDKGQLVGGGPSDSFLFLNRSIGLLVFAFFGFLLLLSSTGIFLLFVMRKKNKRFNESTPSASEYHQRSSGECTSSNSCESSPALNEVHKFHQNSKSTPFNPTCTLNHVVPYEGSVDTDGATISDGVHPKMEGEEMGKSRDRGSILPNPICENVPFLGNGPGGIGAVLGHHKENNGSFPGPPPGMVPLDGTACSCLVVKGMGCDPQLVPEHKEVHFLTGPLGSIKRKNHCKIVSFKEPEAIQAESFSITSNDYNQHHHHHHHHIPPFGHPGSNIHLHENPLLEGTASFLYNNPHGTVYFEGSNPNSCADSVLQTKMIPTMYSTLEPADHSDGHLQIHLGNDPRFL